MSVIAPPTHRGASPDARCDDSGVSSDRSDMLTTAQAADRLGVSIQTVKSWCDAGLLRTWKTAGGHRRIDAAGIEHLVRERDAALRGAAAAAPSESQVLTTTAQNSSRSGVEPPSVIVVEDDPDTRELLVALLSHLIPDSRVRSFADGFVAMVDAGRAMPDLFVVDINLPRFDGLAMLRSLSQHPAASAARFLLITQYDEDELRRFGAMPPGVPLLRKPIQLPALRTALAALRLATT